MSRIQHFRRKPTPASSEDIRVVRYEPGMNLDLFHALANSAAVSGFACREVDFPFPADWGGQPAHVEKILLVRWMDIPDHHAPYEEFRTVRSGRYLATAPNAHLYVTGDRDLVHWYDEVTPGQDEPGPV